MKKILISFILTLSTISITQADNHVKITEQQAGSSYSQNTEDTFKNEIENCEDSGVLMLRSTVKNDISRNNKEKLRCFLKYQVHFPKLTIVLKISTCSCWNKR